MERLFLRDLPIPLTLTAKDGGLTAVYLRESSGEDRPGPTVALAEQQLREYFDGTRFDFDLPLKPVGTSFQRKVWSALCSIRYGQTASYRDIAIAVDRPKGFQAIGQANTRNPLPIVIPCHRVIAADGTLGGYGGGTAIKQLLLDLERRHASL